MLILAHLGGCLGAAAVLGAARRSRFDWIGWVAFFALLPDLLDKAVFYLGLNPLPTSRLWSHSLLFALAVVLFCRFGAQKAWPWVLALPGHLFLDAMWDYPHTLFWPFLGNKFDVGRVVFNNHWEGLLWRWQNDPWGFYGLMLGEVAGGLILLWLWKKRKTYGPKPHNS